MRQGVELVYMYIYIGNGFRFLTDGTDYVRFEISLRVLDMQRNLWERAARMGFYDRPVSFINKVRTMWIVVNTRAIPCRPW